MRIPAIVPILILLAFPLLEIATLIWVGGKLGIFGTIALLIGAGFLGTFLVRWQGLRVLRDIRKDLDTGRLPADKILHGAMIAVAGLLLLLPGFLTDIPGFLLLLPPVRGALVRLMRANVKVVATAGGPRSRGGEGVVDLDPEDFRRQPGDQPWSPPAQPPRLGPE